MRVIYKYTPKKMWKFREKKKFRKKVQFNLVKSTIRFNFSKKTLN